jgi:hypothetical protein
MRVGATTNAINDTTMRRNAGDDMAIPIEKSDIDGLTLMILRKRDIGDDRTERIETTNAVDAIANIPVMITIKIGVNLH